MKILIGTVIFCLLLALCTWLTKPLYQKQIEADLQNKIHNILKDENIDPAGVTLKGHELDLPEGTVLTKSAHQKIDKVIGAYIPPYGAESTDSEFRQPTLAIIENDKGKVILKGLVATEGTRQKIYTAAEAQENGSSTPREIINEINVAQDVAPIQSLPALTALTTSHLNRAGEAQLHYTPTDTKLQGVLNSKDSEKILLSLANPLTKQGNKIDNQLQIISPDAIHFGATRQGGEIVATGTFPDSASQKQYLSLLKKSASDLEVIDKTTLTKRPAQQADTLWWKNSPAEFVPDFLANTTGPASFHYHSKKFTAKGLYPKGDSHSASLAQLKKIPSDIKQDAQLTLLPQEVAKADPAPKAKPDAIHFGAIRKDDEIVATGTFPDPDSQKQYLTLLKKSAGGLKVIDKTTITKLPAEQADALWWKNSPAEFVPDFLANTTGPASFHYHPEEFTAKGLYPKGAPQPPPSASLAQLKKLPADIKQNAQLTLMPQPVAKADPAPEPEIKPLVTSVVAAKEPATPEPAPAPNAQALAQNLKLFPVYFKSGSDYVSEVEKKKIIQAAEAIKNSKEKNLGLTVGGYADTNGDAESNKSLSRKRAKNVRRKLIALGIPSSRLTINHFGEDASQTAEEDLWKSRRVEISLTPLKK